MTVTLTNVRFLLAPGAGAPASSAWMQTMKRHLASLGEVDCFDYRYQRAGRKSPDKPPVLVAAHREALEAVRAKSSEPIILVGKSMGGRIGCHLAVDLADDAPPALVCLGYPLKAQGGAVRDAVLLQQRVPVLFVQGSRDPMGPLEDLEAVCGRMTAKHRLYVVDGGDHSLIVPKAKLKASGRTQDDVFTGIVDAIGSFMGWAGIGATIRHAQ